MRGVLPYVLILAVAAGLRLPQLADRPMHADEAILADKLGTLLETGSWQYDPRDFHGPVLAYASVLLPLLAGIRTYAGLNESLLRIVPAVFGLALVVFPMLLSGTLGHRQAIAASALTAVSPAMVYYSRFYIPEMILTFLTAAALAAGYWYARRPGLRRALLFGALVGLMFAAKETAIISAGAMLGAAAVTARRRMPHWRYAAAAAGVAALTAAALLGPRAALQSAAAYAGRGFSEGRHVHPWYYYLQTLAPADGLVLAIGAAGLSFAFVRTDRLVRFLGLYTATLAAAYALVPYKTPWCSLSFLHGLILLGGVAFGALWTLTPKPARAPAAVLAAICATYLGYVAFRTSYIDASDPKNSYAYAQTTRDVLVIRDRLELLAAAHPEGRNMPVQVFGTQNLWPLPWYLRSFTHVEWWNAIGKETSPAPVIIAPPALEPALAHWLYELRPPGQRHLYVDLFARQIELRPGLGLRGYSRLDLLQSAAVVK